MWPELGLDKLEISPMTETLLKFFSNKYFADLLSSPTEIISGESLRGWTVDVIDDEFQLPPGETREIQVRATPPSELLSDDTYRFTVIAQPEGIPVAGQPIELTVVSVTSNSFLNLSQTTQDLLVYGLTGFGALLVIVLFMRSRAENKRIIRALDQEDP